MPYLHVRAAATPPARCPSMMYALLSAIFLPIATAATDCIHGKWSRANVCVCDAGYTGATCAHKACPGSCSFHGICSEGVCYCAPDWSGKACETRVHDCYFHGNYSAISGTCTCEPGWIGPECQQPDRSCNGRGVWSLSSASCVCEAGYVGAACESKQCPINPRMPSVNCSGLGFCVDGACHCAPGRAGPSCDQLACSAGGCNHGRCQPDGTCKCDIGWGGKTCTKRQCAGLDSWTLTLCSGHGACQADGTCQCRSGWSGIGCADRTCPADAKGVECHGKGVCRDGACFCAPSHDGPACEIALCPRGGPDGAVCGGHGVCSDNGSCECARGYTGAACTLVGCPGDGSCSGHGSCAAVGIGPGSSNPDHPLHFADLSVDVDGPSVEAYRYRVTSPGTSVHRRCQCDAGWSGDACAERTCGRGCEEAEMAGRGKCVDGMCFCRPGWLGESCEAPACFGGCGEDETPPRGACVTIMPPSAAQRVTKTILHVARAANGLNNASHASEEYAPTREWRAVGGATQAEPPPLARCVCREGWNGQRCDQRRCPRPPKPAVMRLPFLAPPPGLVLSPRELAAECSGHGDCNDGTCKCHPGYTGVACERAACHGDGECMQHGTCLVNEQGASATCACDHGYTGIVRSPAPSPNLDAADAHPVLAS